GGKFVDFTIGFSSLNPLTSILSSESIILNHIYLPLTVSNPANIYDIKGRIKLLIEDWCVEPITIAGENATKLTVTFRKDFTWHDGVPVTAYDMEWTILEAGVKRRLIWAYPEMVRQMKKITVLDPYRLEIIVDGRSWQYELDLLTFRPVPAHLWSKVPDITVDPSREPHPSRPDLTLMTGNSYWILKKYTPGKSLTLVWNPNYPMRDPRKKLTLDVVNIPSPIEVGSVLSLSVAVKDYFNQTVPSAEVIAEAKGPITKAVVLKHVSGGVYTGVISELPAGNYSLTVMAKLPVPYGIISGTLTLSIQVSLPTGITIPGVPENLIPPVVTPYSRPPTPSFNLGIEPLASYIPLVIIAVTLIFIALLLTTKGPRSKQANR
ncbi:MAG: ABC transporter substrate-binding protein, partial [Sulfolobales archaeon]